MVDRSTASTERAAAFGPFRLFPAQQLLLEGEAPVRLGSRALEILTALVERPGELVSKVELMARVWPNTFVGESNLKVHVAAVRRALGDGQPGRRYLATVPGRSYRFVAPVEVFEPGKPTHDFSPVEHAHNLPASLPRAIGRADAINALIRELPRRRFISIVGAGGVGKTTIGLAAARALIAVAARTTLSRVLWMQGFPDQAVRGARSTVDEARATDHALSLCNVLAHAACPIALYVGDLTAAERLVATLLETSAKHALTVWNALGRRLKGTLLLARGDIAGLALLRTALDWLREARFGFYDAVFLGTLAQGMAAAGQTAEARMVIDEALERCDRGEGRWCLPELLRIKGELLRLDGSATAVRAAEEHDLQALEWARQQEALSWELRAATSLAELWHQHGRTAEADELLSSVYDRFTEGFETVDLETARALIDRFRRNRGIHPHPRRRV